MASALCGDAQQSLRDLFKDPSPRVQAFAIRAYTRLFQMQAYVRATVTQSLVTRAQEKFRDTVKGTWGVAGNGFDFPGEELRRVLENSQAAPYLFHEQISLLIELWKQIPASAMAGFIKSEPNEVKNMRLAKLLALRRLGNPAVAYFLEDEDPQIVLEAARAINDVPIPAAFPQLAALIAPDGSTLLSLAPGFSPVSSGTDVKAVSTASTRKLKAAEAAQSMREASTGLKPGANEKAAKRPA